MVGNVRKYSRMSTWFLTCIFSLLCHVYLAQKSTNISFVSYAFGLQKMDFFHQASVGIHRPKVRLELQQGFGQRNLASGVVFSQTGIQGAYSIQLGNASLHPFLRYSFGLLGKPFGFHYHRAELGMLCIFEWSRFTKIPVDLMCSSGIGRGREIQSPSSKHGYLEYSINLGLQYAFK